MSNIKNHVVIPRNTIASWVLYSIRRTIGEEDVRNSILKALVPTDSKRVFGSTFVAFINETKSIETQQKTYYKSIKKYLDTITGPKYKNKQICFTIANFPAKVEPENGSMNTDTPLYETHYITVIVTNGMVNHVTYIDPARLPSGNSGIYESFVISDLLKPYFEVKREYVQTFIPVTYAAQTSDSDVFCQSWSLYLMKEALLGKGPVDIPKVQQARYDLLLSFWKEANAVPLFQNVLREDFLSLIDTEINESLSNTNSNSMNKSILSFYKSFDPVTFLNTMKGKDII